MEFLIVLVRFFLFSGALVLFGSPAFLLYCRQGAPKRPPDEPEPKGLWSACASLVFIGSLILVVLQTAEMAGSFKAAFAPGTLQMVMTQTGAGLAGAARAILALAALVYIFLTRRSDVGWSLTAIGAGALGSLAWSGHGASQDGLAGDLHLLADVVHLLSAGIWIGALVMLQFLATEARKPGLAVRRQRLAMALERFSGVGSLMVALLIASGLINGWFMVGPLGWTSLWTTPYGLTLLAKITLFGVMLILALLNRFRFTPQLRAQDSAAGGAAVVRLRLSLAFETLVGFGVLLLVSRLGVLEPLS